MRSVRRRAPPKFNHLNQLFTMHTRNLFPALIAAILFLFSFVSGATTAYAVAVTDTATESEPGVLFQSDLVIAGEKKKLEDEEDEEPDC